jgi:hypothetical protein
MVCLYQDANPYASKGSRQSSAMEKRAMQYAVSWIFLHGGIGRVTVKRFLAPFERDDEDPGVLVFL